MSDPETKQKPSVTERAQRGRHQVITFTKEGISGEVRFPTNEFAQAFAASLTLIISTISTLEHFRRRFKSFNLFEAPQYLAALFHLTLTVIYSQIPDNFFFC